MDRIKKIICSPIAIAAAFVLAVALIGFSTIGGARAALTYYSETYASQVEMRDIGVSLVENGVNVSTRDYYEEYADGTWDEHTGVLLANMLADGERLELGKKYREELTVYNDGTIDTYVRVTLYRYWTDENGKKTREINPSAIELNLVNLTGQGQSEGCWIEDEGSRTDERTVLYYNRLLESGKSTPALSDTIKIDDSIAAHVNTTTKEDGTIVSTYSYNGYKFVLEATVDSVQDHNAGDAILSAWGRNVTVENNILTLKQ